MGLVVQVPRDGRAGARVRQELAGGAHQVAAHFTSAWPMIAIGATGEQGHWSTRNTPAAKATAEARGQLRPG